MHRVNLCIFLWNALFVSLRQSGCRQFHNVVPNAGKDLSFIFNLDFCTKRLFAHEKQVLYAWTSDEWIKSSRIILGVERVETSCIMVETVSKQSILIGKMLEATKRGMAWDLLLETKIKQSARFCRVRIFFKSHWDAWPQTSTLVP